MQADIFSFGCLMYELLTGAITSQVVVGPTGNVRAAEVYAAQASAVALSAESLSWLFPDAWQCQHHANALHWVACTRHACNMMWNSQKEPVIMMSLR